MTLRGLSLILVAGVFGCSRSPVRAANACHQSSPGHPEPCLKQLCDGGNLVACAEYAITADDEREASAAAERACNGGFTQACGTLARLLRKSRDSDGAKIAALYQRACDGDSWMACCDVADLYDRGDGVPKDAGRAAAIRKAANEHKGALKAAFPGDVCPVTQEEIPDWLKAKPQDAGAGDSAGEVTHTCPDQTRIGLGKLGTVGRNPHPHDDVPNLGSRLRLGNVGVQGALDKHAVVKALRDDRGWFQFCYDKELIRRRDLHGELSLELTISPSGRVASSAVKQSTLGNRALEECVASFACLFEFPQPRDGNVAVVSSALAFENGKK